MRLESQRLYLVPLTAANLVLAVDNYSELQQKLGLNLTPTELDKDMIYAMNIRHRKVLLDEKNYLWLTNWAIIHTEEQCIIGYLILKGCPNERGEVIIGYTIDEYFRGKGYATEALRTITQWIFSQPGARYVLSDTEKSNIPSHKVLQHLGAQLFQETDDLLWWKISSNAI